MDEKPARNGETNRLDSATAGDAGYRTGRTPPLATDGGERRQGKAAPPEDVLAAPANQLDTEPHPQDVTAEIIELLDAAETLVEAVDQPRDHGIDPSAPEIEQLTALADAVQDGELTLDTESASTHSKTIDVARKLEDGVQKTRSRQSVESDAAYRLLEDLESVRTRQTDQLAATLEETVDQLEQHQQLQNGIGSLPSRRNPHELGRELAEGFDGRNVDHGRRLANVGRALESTADDLETCRNEHRQLREAVENVCATAATQTNWSAGTNDAEEAVGQLATALDDEEVWFADEATSIAGLAANVETATAQSKPAAEFLNVLRNVHTTDDRRIQENLENAVEAIDRTETVTTRLEGVDPDAVVRTADRLLTDLDSHTNAVVPHLRERIEDISETARRSNDVDLLTLYAARQELRYYDRTLIPQLSDPDDTGIETEGLSARIEAVDERRSSMRQSYPSEYPDCDHTIPIYFFDLASTLLDEASDLQTRGETQQATGVVDAAERVLDWIEGMYETHSYFVLLKELRG